MDVEITPEPEERDVVEAAIEALLSRDVLAAAYRSGWRERGIRENVWDDQGETGRPRSRPGATRA